MILLLVLDAKNLKKILTLIRAMIMMMIVLKITVTTVR